MKSELNEKLALYNRNVGDDDSLYSRAFQISAYKCKCKKSLFYYLDCTVHVYIRTKCNFLMLTLFQSLESIEIEGRLYSMLIRRKWLEKTQNVLNGFEHVINNPFT